MKKTDGFTLFIVDLKAKGLQKQYIPVSIPAPETQWQLFFDDVDLGPDDIVGEIDKGFGILFKSLNPERILVGSICCGLGRYALNRAVDMSRSARSSTMCRSALTRACNIRSQVPGPMWKWRR